MDRILVNDLARHTALIAAEIRHAVDKVLAKGWYVLGEEGEAFEREFAEFSGAAHCVGVANGTDALELAFRALGIGAGSRVATVANAGCYATTALSLVGATPVFIDVAETDHLMDVELLAGAASAGGIDAVVVTHLFGLCMTWRRFAPSPVATACLSSRIARKLMAPIVTDSGWAPPAISPASVSIQPKISAPSAMAVRC